MNPGLSDSDSDVSGVLFFGTRRLYVPDESFCRTAECLGNELVSLVVGVAAGLRSEQVWSRV